MYNMLLACCSAVVVFPHHFGPSISTAPFEASLSANILSAILLLYSIVLQLISSYANVQIKIRISAVGTILFPQLARFHFRSWRVFTSSVGVFDVVMKSVGSILCKKQSSFFR